MCRPSAPCEGEGWSPWQHPKTTADNGALHAARAALRNGCAQGWIQDETARVSVIYEENPDRVTDTGQTEVALHSLGREGGPAEGLVMDPTGMVLDLAADMVRGVLHAFRLRRAGPQWIIQVYTTVRAWPFST